MSYTIGEVAEMTGITAHTLRYYDRMGIMPYLHKDEHGNRVFEKADLQWLTLVKCMKVSGFSIAEMQEYVKLQKQGDATLSERLAMFQAKRQETLEQIERLRKSLDALNYKCWYYQQAVDAGTERVHLAAMRSNSGNASHEYSGYPAAMQSEGSPTKGNAPAKDGISPKQHSDAINNNDNTFDLAQCYYRFKEWEATKLGHPSDVYSLFDEPAKTNR